MTIFQERLKELRIEKNASQKELAQIIGTTNSSICDWERGRTQPGLAEIIKLCEFFQISTDYLLGRTDELGAVITPFPSTDNYTEEEKKLIADYRELTPPLRRMIQETLSTWKKSEINTKKLS